MHIIRYGIMGTAQIATRFVAAVRDSEGGEVVALASREEDKARLRAQELGISRVYGNYEALLEDPEVDVIYVPSINAMHYDHAKRALEKGKSVLCEKPLTLSSRETAELFHLAESQGIFLMEAQKCVFLPVTQALKELVRRGTLGTIRHLEYNIAIPHVGFQWFYEKKAGGGLLQGNGTYLLSHAMELLEEEMEDGQALATLGNTGVDLQCTLQFRTASGVLIRGFMTTLTEGASYMRITGDQGMVEIPNFWKAREALVLLKGKEAHTLSFPVDHEMVYEVNHVNACLRQGKVKSEVMSPEKSIRIAEIVERLIAGFSPE